MSEFLGSWQPLQSDVRFTAESIAELLDGGQAFRWHRRANGVWRGMWSHHVVEVAWGKSSRLQWRPLTPVGNTTESDVRNYLRLEHEHPELYLDVLPWRSDAHLRKCITAFPGLRILRQPFGETLLGFLCSATKQIVQIKQMLALLADHHGSPSQVCHHNGDKLDNLLPTWDQLAGVPEAALRACQLGFRARYIKGTAEYIAAHPGWLEHTATLPYTEAKEALCVLPGVGEKIADCVALFGLGHQQAFPVDTWMIKSMARRYGLEGWSPTQVAHFGRVHFGPSAGLAQQYLFAWERGHGGR
ncbi:MAG: DNA-binding protein [Opitutaceae bacterium]|jgi:N-glycosylase/DNA lyase|nr:DNA-binding protein [Opitutaceae bacterium]